MRHVSLQHFFHIACDMSCCNIVIYDIALHRYMSPYCFLCAIFQIIFFCIIAYCMLHCCKISRRNVARRNIARKFYHFRCIFGSSAHPNVLSYAIINTSRVCSPLSKLWTKFKRNEGQFSKKLNEVLKKILY